MSREKTGECGMCIPTRGFHPNGKPPPTMTRPLRSRRASCRRGGCASNRTTKSDVWHRFHRSGKCATSLSSPHSASVQDTYLDTHPSAAPAREQRRVEPPLGGLRLGGDLDQPFRRDPLGFRLKVHDDAMAENGHRHGVHVLEIRNAAPIHRRASLRAEDQVL
jgi:hypothetical protein